VTEAFVGLLDQSPTHAVAVTELLCVMDGEYAYSWGKMLPIWSYSMSSMIRIVSLVCRGLPMAVLISGMVVVRIRASGM